MGEGGNEFGSAVGVTAVVDRIDAQCQGACATCFRHRQSEAQQHRVACRHIGRGHAVRDFFGRASLGQRHCGIHQSTSPKGSQIDREHDMVGDAEPSGDGPGRLHLAAVPLSVLHSEC